MKVLQLCVIYDSGTILLQLLAIPVIEVLRQASIMCARQTTAQFSDFQVENLAKPCVPIWVTDEDVLSVDPWGRISVFEAGLTRLKLTFPGFVCGGSDRNVRPHSQVRFGR